MNKDELIKFRDEVVELCKFYRAEENMTTSDFQGGLDAIINKWQQSC